MRSCGSGGQALPPGQEVQTPAKSLGHEWFRNEWHNKGRGRCRMAGGCDSRDGG